MFNVQNMDQKLAQTTTVGSGMVSAASEVFSNELGVFVGIVGVVAGIGLQVFFGWRRDRRERKLFELKRDKLDGSD